MNRITRVRAFDLTRQIENMKPELMKALERVLDSGQFILGSEVLALEEEIGSYLEVKHAIGVASGTDALWLALRALGVGPGDKVLTVPFTFFATASAILNTGAEPVLVDIEEETFNMDPDQVAKLLLGQSPVHRRLGLQTESIKAIIPVHLYGLASEMGPLRDIARERGIPLIEDAAQAMGTKYHGRSVGGLGDLGCFSFFPTKNLGAFGDGGLVTTEDDALAEKVRLLRAHGSHPKYYHHVIGTNSRLDAFQAAILQVKLKYLDGWVAARQACATFYENGLQKSTIVKTPSHPADHVHTYHQYTIRVLEGHRDELQTFLKESGIETGIYYPVPLHRQPALLHLGYKEGDFPRAEQASREALSLPMYPELTREEQTRVISAIEDFERQCSSEQIKDQARGKATAR
jgi:dTDP-4-amino-4,6-dideoxygalactose transaminase